MAKKYIELEAAIMAIEKPKVTPGGVIFDALKKACQEEVRNLPAADVVPVVRCRECRYAPSGTDDGFGLEWPEDKPYHTNPCPFNIEDGWYSHKPQPDFFCANGKRKDGGHDDD
jgi:hypothetical protein